MSDAAEFGARLKSVRERGGVALGAIAAVTKVSASHFAAMERGDLSRWPSGIFARGFIREYAQAVGLDPAATLAEFARITGDPERKSRSAAGVLAVASPSPPVVASAAPVPLPAAIRLSLVADLPASVERVPAAGPRQPAWWPILGEGAALAVVATATWWWATGGVPLLVVGVATITYYAAGLAVWGQSPVQQFLSRRSILGADIPTPQAATGDRRRIGSARPAATGRRRRGTRPRQSV